MIITDTGKLNIHDLVGLAAETGFSHAALLDTRSLEFRSEVREMCSADTCRSYGRSWSCPPAAGGLDVIERRARRFTGGIIVQTTGEVADDFDIDRIHGIMDGHQRNFDTLVRQIRMLSSDCMPMGAGACSVCRRCTYPDRPCRYPDRMYPSMEACGLLVSEVCTGAGLEYNYGEHTMTFTSCILMNVGNDKGTMKEL